MIARAALGVVAGATLMTAWVCRDLEVPVAAVVGCWATFVAVGGVLAHWLISEARS
jgi:hypothetical protein